MGRVRVANKKKMKKITMSAYVKSNKSNKGHIKKEKNMKKNQIFDYQESNNFMNINLKSRKCFYLRGHTVVEKAC